MSGRKKLRRLAAHRDAIVRAGDRFIILDGQSNMPMETGAAASQPTDPNATRPIADTALAAPVSMIVKALAQGRVVIDGQQNLTLPPAREDI
jgi:hypothetical protein